MQHERIREPPPASSGVRMHLTANVCRVCRKDPLSLIGAGFCPNEAAHASRVSSITRVTPESPNDAKVMNERLACSWATHARAVR